jgi:predicted DNA-binding transcriptional regulator AlpA
MNPFFVEGSGGWLTVREAAIYLKVSRQTIYDLIGRGSWPTSGWAT